MLFNSYEFLLIFLPVTIARLLDGGSLSATANLVAHPALADLLMFLPVYAGFLPAPGSRTEARFSACTARVQQIVKGRPRMGSLNLRRDDATTRDVNRFVEVTARAIVPEIAAAILHMTSSN